jgi:hypothetical protein
MSDADLTEEVDRFVGGLGADDETTNAKQRRKAARDAAKAVKALPAPQPEYPPEREEEEEDSASMLPRELPRPAETQRSLGSLLSKYQIGEIADFKIQLHRILPKFFPGGIQAHGYVEEFVHPITEEYIASEYGGGTYEIRVLGPDPKNPPSGICRFDSIRVEMSGAPNPSRLARSVQAKLDASSGVATPVPMPQQMMVQQENPGLATQALKMAGDMAEREREERRRAEDKQTAIAEASRAMHEPLVEAERRRADDVLKVERERAASERAGLEERLRDSRDELRRLETKVEAMNNAPHVSLSEELGKLIPMIKGDGEAAAAGQRAAESITKNILDRHQTEVEALHKQHQTMLESLRASHVSEVASMREAGRREVDTEREAGRLREQRHEETLKVEREERRRDMELYKRTADERDQQWRDRMEQQELNLKTTWESRVETQKTAYESQLTWQRSEYEQLQARLRNFEAQAVDRGDLVKQLTSMGDLRSAAKNALGIEDPPPPAAAGSGGIGLSGDGSQSWQEVISTAIENLPAIWNTLNNQGGGPQQGAQQQGQPVQQPQQPPPQPGQIIQTAQGTMVVVKTANGQLALTPKDQFDAYQAQQHASRQVGPGVKPRGILGQPRQQQRPSDGIPVPNMAEGLPLKPRQWGEAVQPPPPDQAQAAVPAQPQQRRGRTTSKPQQGVADDKMKTLIAKEVAKLVHQSVESGDEPEDFVQKVIKGGYPDVIVKTIAGMSDEEVIAGIKQAEPNSAGATPAGQRFVHEALAALRAAV